MPARTTSRARRSRSPTTVSSSRWRADVAAPPGFQPAHLELEGGQKIKCLFKPNQYSIQKSNKWDVKEVVGKGLPKPQFGGGVPRTLLKMMEVDPGLKGGVKGKNTGRPPHVTFTWGKVLTFQAVPDSLSI